MLFHKLVVRTKYDIYVFINEIELNIGPCMKINKIFISQNRDMIQHKPCKMFMNNQVIDIYMHKWASSWFCFGGDSIGFSFFLKNYKKNNSPNNNF